MNIYFYAGHHKIVCTLDYLKLLRPKDWAKNLFILLPVFFSGELFEWSKYPALIGGIIAFSCLASSIYIINDYRDIEDDRKHHEKKSGPWPREQFQNSCDHYLYCAHPDRLYNRLS
jgi:decaprenyl-phosphate phosphoribosyltransferase